MIFIPDSLLTRRNFIAGSFFMVISIPDLLLTAGISYIHSSLGVIFIADSFFLSGISMQFHSYSNILCIYLYILYTGKCRL